MPFTGVTVRQGTADRFGVGSPGSIPRAFVSFRNQPYVITRDALVHITDLVNGSGVLIQNNTDYDLDDADPTCGFVWNDRMYFLNRATDQLFVFDDPLTGDVGLIDFYTGVSTPSAAATDGTTVWIYESSFDALHTINPATAATTLLGTVGFDVTTPANNIGGMFYYDGKLYLLDNGTELMFVIDDLSAATLEATAVDVDVVEFGASQRGVNGGGAHNGEAYMAGGNPDALYRFYNVRWDETIGAVEVNAGGNGSLDLSTVSSDATSFEFTPGYTAPSWLTISGNNLVITSAPDVTSDTDYSPEVRAVRGSFHEDETLTVRVLAAAAITVSGAPTSLSLSETHNSIVATWAAADDNGGESPTRYDIRIDGGAWIDTGLDLTHTFLNLSAETQYTIEVAQVNSAGRGAIASVSVTTSAAPITAPSAPRSLIFTLSDDYIIVSWLTASDNGGEDPSRYDVRIDGGSWISANLETFYLFSNLSPETEYTIEVAQVNSAGRGAIASEDVTTDAIPVIPLTFGDSTIANQAWVVGTAVSITLPQATGGSATITYSLSPTIPDGVTFTAGTRRLAGTPTGRFAIATFTYTATAGSESVELTFTIVVTAPAIVFNPLLFGNQSWVVGTAVNRTLPSASGGVGTLTPSLTGTLPNGVTFTASTRMLAGTPTAIFAATTFTYIMTDTEGESAFITFRITVATDPNALSIEAIDEQFITIGTKDYRLVVDVGGDPDDVFPSGHMEGFTHHWDAANGKLHIKSDEVTRLIAGVHWNVEAVKSMQNLMGQIAYNVVKAAPIFQTLQTIHLYRGVDINFDILIQNIPPLLIPNAYLIGLKSELLEYGINVKGRMETADNWTFTSGNIEIIVPSEREGEADTVHEYPFEIESGSPPQIVSPKFTPHGNFGELEFPDVTHALGYEWTRETGDDAEWHFFSDARNVINPREVEVTPGKLNVTIKFPNVNNASAYEYQLESENHEVEWTRFTGTLSNNMITTIIPDLQEGEEYTLRLRVASPWMGPPIEVTVFGGRFAYVLQEDSRNRENQYLYIFHTGVGNGGTASRIKRVLLPTAITHPSTLAVNGNLAYILNDNDATDTALYVIDFSGVADDARASTLRKNPLPSAIAPTIFFRGMGFYDDELYIYARNFAAHADSGWYPGAISVCSATLSDGATLIPTRNTLISDEPVGSGMSVDFESMFWIDGSSSSWYLDSYDRNSGLETTPRNNRRRINGIRSSAAIDGITVINDNLYIIYDQSQGSGLRFQRYEYNTENISYEKVWEINTPTGLSRPFRLNIST